MNLLDIRTACKSLVPGSADNDDLNTVIIPGSLNSTLDIFP